MPSVVREFYVDYFVGFFCGIFFFFSSRRRHTRFDCDWSSDVCSSDLVHAARAVWRRHPVCLQQRRIPGQEIGRASCRKSVDLGGRRIIKKKKKKNSRSTEKRERKYHVSREWEQRVERDDTC